MSFPLDGERQVEQAEPAGSATDLRQGIAQLRVAWPSPRIGVRARYPWRNRRGRRADSFCSEGAAAKAFAFSSSTSGTAVACTRGRSRRQAHRPAASARDRQLSRHTHAHSPRRKRRASRGSSPAVSERRGLDRRLPRPCSALFAPTRYRRHVAEAGRPPAAPDSDSRSSLPVSPSRKAGFAPLRARPLPGSHRGRTAPFA